MRTRIIATTLIAVAALLLTACSSTSSAEEDVNSADVAFATDMIPHHRQATEMAAMAPSRTENAEVLDLAGRIQAAQDPEIDTMTSWLESWGEEIPGDMSGMDMSSMSGMMSADQMSQLRDSSGEAFDRLFLTMMIEHHEGAIEMAQVEQAEGVSRDAQALAAEIEQAQTAEIAEMKDLLGS